MERALTFRHHRLLDIKTDGLGKLNPPTSAAPLTRLRLDTGETHANASSTAESILLRTTGFTTPVLRLYARFSTIALRR